MYGFGAAASTLVYVVRDHGITRLGARSTGATSCWATASASAQISESFADGSADFAVIGSGALSAAWGSGDAIWVELDLVHADPASAIARIIRVVD